MKFKTNTGMFRAIDNGIVMTVKSAAALVYGDIVILDETNNDPATGMTSVKTTTSADSVLVAGVVCSPGGIDAGGVGEIGVFGIFDVNVVSGAHASGSALTTSTTAGSADDGTETLLCHFGKVHYTAGGTVTTVKAWVNVL